MISDPSPHRQAADTKDVPPAFMAALTAVARRAHADGVCSSSNNVHEKFLMGRLKSFGPGSEDPVTITLCVIGYAFFFVLDFFSIATC
jgi:hypothetical protein